jgi:hypothetical protein
MKSWYLMLLAMYTAGVRAEAASTPLWSRLLRDTVARAYRSTTAAQSNVCSRKRTSQDHMLLRCNGMEPEVIPCSYLFIPHCAP